MKLLINLLRIFRSIKIQMIQQVSAIVRMNSKSNAWMMMY
jgi:hypothetical protein